MSKPFIIVATPCFGSMVTQPYLMSMLQLTHRAARDDIDIDVLALGGDSLISRARSTLVSHFLANEAATHLLFVDADIAFEPDQVFRLLGFDKEFVGGMYPLKQVDWRQVPIRALAGEPLAGAGLSYVGKLCSDPSDLKVENGFATAVYAGTGFQLIKRSVFERMAVAYPDLQFEAVDILTNARPRTDKLFAFFECVIDRETRTYLSEDYSFCQRWRAIGGDIWLDLQSKLTHSGMQHFTGDTTLRFSGLQAHEPEPEQPILDLAFNAMVSGDAFAESAGQGQHLDGVGLHCAAA